MSEHMTLEEIMFRLAERLDDHREAPYSQLVVAFSKAFTARETVAPGKIWAYVDAVLENEVYDIDMLAKIILVLHKRHFNIDLDVLIDTVALRVAARERSAPRKRVRPEQEQRSWYKRLFGRGFAANPGDDTGDKVEK